MIRLVKFIVILIIVYSIGFISGMRYQGSADEAEALKQDLTDKAKIIKQHGEALIEKVQ